MDVHPMMPKNIFRAKYLSTNPLKDTLSAAIESIAINFSFALLNFKDPSCPSPIRYILSAVCDRLHICHDPDQQKLECC